MANNKYRKLRFHKNIILNLTLGLLIIIIIIVIFLLIYNNFNITDLKTFTTTLSIIFLLNAYFIIIKAKLEAMKKTKQLLEKLKIIKINADFETEEWVNIIKQRKSLEKQIKSLEKKLNDLQAMGGGPNEF